MMNRISARRLKNYKVWMTLPKNKRGPGVILTVLGVIFGAILSRIMKYYDFLLNWIGVNPGIQVPFQSMQAGISCAVVEQHRDHADERTNP